ncbi:hypothetical protein CYLTODRAFT_125911 [Cylindrobasidium torrendii FP15055 ss-10]|uniref:C2H2-type domain-containing protein n=1 Tax=Cylindrobasidium torrendii FP15055 ss-10 TaxID=1314674 RepID=A0A0D7B0T5_9AGAR|nr:hypothetical protein CYLTODRAFT_125911 [Cylindrobasidium torrendii FP15055 ss-10]
MKPETTTRKEIEEAQSFVKVTEPKETPLFICLLPDCCRLFPTRDRILGHRKRDHPDLPEEDLEADILTWNEEPPQGEGQ